MSYCLIAQHDAAFGPGRVVNVLRDYGIPTRLLRLYEGQAMPTDWDEVRLLVLLGGTPRFTGDDDPYSTRPDWLDVEVDAIRTYVADDRPTLAFGLGAQILAKALGSEITPMSAGEGDVSRSAHLGWSEITLPFPGGTDPILFGLGNGTPMFFWQKDLYELPKLPGSPPAPSGNALLASTKWDKNAGFRFHNRLYGFNFHPELTRENLAEIHRAYGGAIGAAHGSQMAEAFKSNTDKHFARYERVGTRLLENYVQYLKAYEHGGF